MDKVDRVSISNNNTSKINGDVDNNKDNKNTGNNNINKNNREINTSNDQDVSNLNGTGASIDIYYF